MTGAVGRLLLGAALVALLATGCQATATPAAAPGAASSCLAPASPGSGEAKSGTEAGAGSGTPLPDVSLPCFTGGTVASGSGVRLGALGRPAVLNLWASSCAPCRAELPAIERYASRAGGRVTVIGVDTADTGTGGGSVIADLGLTYPNLFDDRQLLLHGLGRAAIPVTLFVDAGGRVRHVYASGTALTEEVLAQLVREYLGIAT